MTTATKPPTTSARRRAAALAALALFALVVAWTSGLLPRLAPSFPPADLGARPVELRSGPGGTLRGWFAPGRAGAGAVLLLHGIGGSASSMLGRARFLRAAGRSVLLLDFRGHGASSAARTTYGALESRDVRAALDFIRGALPRERIGVIGVSMGGAAALLGPSPLPVQALVLESVFPTIDDAVRDRLRAWLGSIGPALAPLVVTSLFPREGVTAADLRPIDRIHGQTAPLLVLAGAEDRYTPLPESRALFARAREPKAFWKVTGAAHVDLHAFSAAEYERRVGGFLARHLDAARDGSGAELARADGPRGVEPEDHAQRAERVDDPAERDRRDE